MAIVIPERRAYPYADAAQPRNWRDVVNPGTAKHW